MNAKFLCFWFEGYRAFGDRFETHLCVIAVSDQQQHSARAVKQNSPESVCFLPARISGGGVFCIVADHQATLTKLALY